MSFEKTKMEVTGMKLKELLKKIDNREMLNIYNKEKDFMHSINSVSDRMCRTWFSTK